MSKYLFIASNSSLPEIDLTAAKKMKYGEYKKLHKEVVDSKSILSQLDNKDDELEILIMDPTMMNHLNITACTNPPYGLEKYIKKDFVYWLEGYSDAEVWKEQLYDYLIQLNGSSDGLEIWSIWFGDGTQDIEKIQLKLSELKGSDLEVIKSMKVNYCITFE